APLQPGQLGNLGAFAIMAASAEAHVEFRAAHLTPLLGPVWRAKEKSAAQKARLRRVGRDVLGEPPRDLAALDALEDTLGLTTGILQGTGQGLLLGGAAA